MTPVEVFNLALESLAHGIVIGAAVAWTWRQLRTAPKASDQRIPSSGYRFNTHLAPHDRELVEADAERLFRAHCEAVGRKTAWLDAPETVKSMFRERAASPFSTLRVDNPDA